MKKSRFSELQIIKLLNELESGRSVNDLACEHGVGQATIYNWKSNYSGIQVSQLKKMKVMESELAQFKRIVADLTFKSIAFTLSLDSTCGASTESGCHRV